MGRGSACFSIVLSPAFTFRAQGGPWRLIGDRVQKSHESGGPPLRSLWITRGAVGPSTAEGCRGAVPLPLRRGGAGGGTSRHRLLPAATESGDLTAESAAHVSPAAASGTPVLGSGSKQSITAHSPFAGGGFGGGHGNSSRPGVEKLWPLSQEQFLHL